MDQGEAAATLATSTSTSGRTQFAREALSAPGKTNNGAGILILSLVVFAAVNVRDASVQDVVVLVAVLLLHESGHLLGMRIFKFADLRMFFLPFFGAAATGRKLGASAAQRAIVALAGPLPGILIALPLLALAGRGSLHTTPTPLLAEVVFSLAAINLLNLLPIVPLDGGRFFESVLFSRWPVLDIAFRGLAILALAWGATQGMPILGVAAALLALTLPGHGRVAFAARRLRSARPLPADPGSLSDDDLFAIYCAADAATAQNTGGYDRTKLIATNVGRVFERAASQNTTAWQTIGLMLVWAIGIVVGFAELVVLALK